LSASFLNDLNGAKRLNDWNIWNGLIPVTDAHDRKIAALVGEKAHRLSVSLGFCSRRHEQSFFVSQRIRCIAYGRLNILT
jgi:hypothetical protein